jgi:FkbM family methyltransferase
LATGIKLLLTNPRGFIHRARDIVTNHCMEQKLALMVADEDGEMWATRCGIHFLYSNDGDLQEVLYHANFRRWLEQTRECFSRWLRPGDTAVDVGANMGFTSVVMSQLVGPAGVVHSFEPSPRIHEKLKKVVARNGLTNVICHCKGCGRKTEQLPLWTPASSGNATMCPSAELIDRSIRKDIVHICAIDEDLGPQLDRLDFLKIDTEGYELDVLLGSANTIARHQPVIFIELSSEHRESSQLSIEWMKSRGYVFIDEPDLDVAHNGDNFFAVHSSRLNKR